MIKVESILCKHSHASSEYPTKNREESVEMRLNCIVSTENEGAGGQFKQCATRRPREAVCKYSSSAMGAHSKPAGNKCFL